MIPKLRLKREKESLINRKHPWIFSGAVKNMTPAEVGELCEVVGEKGDFLAFGFVNPSATIACRVLSYDPQFSYLSFIEDRLTAAYEEKKSLLGDLEQAAYRLVNAEADGLPGLIIDIYDKVACIQITLLAIEQRKEHLVSFLTRKLGIIAIYEKSTAAARKIEGLPSTSGWLAGSIPAGERVFIKEHGLLYGVAIETGQKTGFFIDQRDMRFLARRLSAGRSVLNCFAYTGGFSINALAGGATRVVSLDTSESACRLNEENTKQNGFDDKHEILCQDVYDYLKNSKETFDLIILDPPPFVKKANDLRQGSRHYLELQRLGFSRLKKGGILFSFSCSPFMPSEDFHRVVSQAATSAGKQVKVLTEHHHAFDHGVLLSHPEGGYLKGIVVKEVAF